MKIVVTGDIHGEFGTLNSYINSRHPDIILCCGDFGYWPEEKNYSLKILKPQTTKIYWCPGNHEQWDQLEERHGRRGPVPIEIKPNIFYCPIGSHLEINGKDILFVGGADSIDKALRTKGFDWFPQELLNQEDLDYILQYPKKVDMIISHTCPSLFPMRPFETPEKVIDPTRKVLDIILEQFHPRDYFYGHWHQSLRGRLGDTFYECLNNIPYTNWWKEIDI